MSDWVSRTSMVFKSQKYPATVVSNENVATFIKELVLKMDADESLSFKAGAYIQIDIPEYELSFSQFRQRVGTGGEHITGQH